jgi:hypothetical protein
MLRLSIVGLETTHGFIYPALLNGYDPERLVANSVPMVAGIFPTAGAPSVAGARIVACYDDVPERARLVAEACRVERVCPTPADALRGVDGVLICAGDARIHRKLAESALAAGLAIFVDKPFTETSADAEALVELAEQRGAPIFCTSALRFAPQIVALRERLTTVVGMPVTAHSIGTGDYDSYAVHSLETLAAVWGSGIARLQSIGAVDHDTVQLTYHDGRRAVWQVCRTIGWFFHVAVYGSLALDQAFVQQSDRYVLFKSTAEQIVRFFDERQSPVPIAETLEIVRVLETARRERGSGRTVAV